MNPTSSTEAASQTLREQFNSYQLGHRIYIAPGNELSEAVQSLMGPSSSKRTMEGVNQ
jgi:hypothetical protein